MADEAVALIICNSHPQTEQLLKNILQQSMLIAKYSLFLLEENR